jgi:pimeloyl-ACP methyl ester carboxylesterase
VLLNPLPQSILAFDPIWEKLIHHLNVFAVDLPGFGGSEGGSEFMTFAAQGDFLKKIIKSMNIQLPHIVGPDIGMPAALSYVMNHENDVVSLLVGDCPGIYPSSNGSIIQRMVDLSFWRFVFSLSAGAFVEAGNRLGYVNYVPRNEEIADYVASYSGRVAQVTQWFKDYPKSLASLDPGLNRIKLLVKIFWGDLDKLLYAENVERLHNRLKRSEIHIFKNCGHFSYQDRADEFTEMILTWVGGRFREF